MKLLVWDERLSVGEPSIDARHEALVEALNELNGAVMRGAERNRTGTLLRTFVAYIRNQWAAEERAMARINFPGLETRKGLQRQLLQTVESQLDRFEHGESLNLDALRSLRDALVNHIRQIESIYRPWIEAKVKEAAQAAAPKPQTSPQPSKESCVEANAGVALASEARS
ncbi:MAG TPA: hemerythrin family protein [Terracidiphilus sp.]|jgi:hemerythrin|nr:hemerythrin family protein [Terracidiphilus sp.]